MSLFHLSFNQIRMQSVCTNKYIYINQLKLVQALW